MLTHTAHALRFLEEEEIAFFAVAFFALFVAFLAVFTFEVVVVVVVVARVSGARSTQTKGPYGCSYQKNPLTAFLAF